MQTYAELQAVSEQYRIILKKKAVLRMTDDLSTLPMGSVAGHLTTEVIASENQLYHQMNQQDGLSRPLRNLHSGELFHVNRAYDFYPPNTYDQLIYKYLG